MSTCCFTQYSQSLSVDDVHWHVGLCGALLPPVQRWRRDAPASVSSSSLLLSHAVSERLEAHQLQFETLPGLLQRALLWNAGLAFAGGDTDDSSQLVQIWTRCDSSMADIAIHPQEFAQTPMPPSCTIESCSPTGRGGGSSEVAAFISQCDQKAINPLIKCAISEATPTGIPVLSNASIWSHESPSDLEARVPSFSVLAVAMDLFIDRKLRNIRTAAVPSLDSANMDITEQSVQQSVVSGWFSARSSTG